MDPKVKRLVEQVKAFLHERYGEGIKRVILYGSHARGEATKDSDVDVLVLVMAGEGALMIDGEAHELSTGPCALVPKGTTRSLAAGAHGLAYLTVHRSRPGLRLTVKPPEA